jgi:DnaJ-class molecular chaperone
MSGNPTHYEVLGVSKYATYEEIKESFHRLARAKHPDKQRRRRQNHPQQRQTTNDNDDVDVDSHKQQNDESDDHEHAAVGGVDQTTQTQMIAAAAAEFRTIQQAWQVLRDDEERRAYDSDLLHRDLHTENKRNGALLLSFHEDLEEAIDEETNERFMVYDCRCGEEIHIEMSDSDNSVNAENDAVATEYCKTANDSGERDDDIMVDCPGCCFVYRIVGK